MSETTKLTFLITPLKQQRLHNPEVTHTSKLILPLGALTLHQDIGLAAVTNTEPVALCMVLSSKASQALPQANLFN